MKRSLIDRARIRPDGGRTDQDASWKAGTERRVITPQDPVWMAGYMSRDKPSEGTEHDLQARALALEDATGRRLVLVAAELIQIPREMRLSIERACQREYGLDPEALVLNASHTHCGPEIRTKKAELFGIDERHVDRIREYRSRLEEQVIEVVGSALEDTTPAGLRFSRSRCAVGMNRRRPTEAGIALNPYPEGAVHHDVPVLSVESDGAIRAVVFGYACHPTTLGGDFYRFCGDWAGYAQHYLEETYDDATALFVQGCGADQNPYPRESLTHAKRHGRTVATSVEAALSARGRAIRGPLRILREEPVLEFQEPTRAELEERLQSDVAADRNHAAMFLEELEETGDIETTRPYPVGAVGFGGDLTMLTLSGEVFSRYARRLQREFDQPTWIAAYCHESFVYVPTVRALHEGGYETARAPTRFPVPGPPEPSVERTVFESARALAGQVHTR